MTPHFQPVRPGGKESQSENDISSDLSEIFSDNGSFASDSSSNLELDSDDLDDNDKINNNSFSDEG